MWQNHTNTVADAIVLLIRTLLNSWQCLVSFIWSYFLFLFNLMTAYLDELFFMYMLSLIAACTRWMKLDVGLFILVFLIDVAVILPSSRSGISKGTLAGIVSGAVAVAVILSAIVSLFILRKRMKYYHRMSRRRHCEYIIIVGKQQKH